MAAPSASFLTQVRKGSLARHHCFYMAHPDGAVRVWDGVGDIVVNGDTYKGVGSLGTVANLSDSRDLQNHSVEVQLSAVPFSVLGSENLNVRGVAATLLYAWLDIDNNAVATRIAFDGIVNGVSARPGERDHIVKVQLRSFISSWSAVLGAFYTPEDQAATYPTDTGLSEIKKLENAQITGWGLTTPLPANQLTRQTSGNIQAVIDTVTLDVIGHNTNGPSYRYRPIPSSPPYYYYFGDITGNNYIDETTSAPTIVYTGGSSDAFYDAFKVALYVDSASPFNVKTPSGTFVGLSSGSHLRRQGAIASTGTATANNVKYTFDSTYGSYIIHSDVTASVLHTANDRSKTVYDNNGAFLGDDATTLTRLLADYEEQGTGNAITVSGTNLQCNGANLKISTTGCVITNTTNRVTRKASVGGTANNFLRIWT